MTTLRSITLIGVNGDSIDLANNENIELGVSPNLHSGPSFSFVDKPLVGFAGGFKSASRPTEKLFNIPVVLFGSSEQEIDEIISRLVNACDPKEQCQLIYARPDGTTRSMYLQYRAGLETALVADRRNFRVKANLVFRAAYPFWQQHEDQPSATLDLTGINVNTGVSWRVEVSGDIEQTWPRWRIEGHAENIQIIHPASGLFFRVEEILTNANVVRVITNPRDSGVYLDDVQDYATVLDNFSTLFPFHPGSNLLIVKASIPTAPAGSIKVEWDNHFQTP